MTVISSSSCPLPLTMVQRRDIPLAKCQSYVTGTSEVIYTRALICQSLSEGGYDDPHLTDKETEAQGGTGFWTSRLVLALFYVYPHFSLF